MTSEPVSVAFLTLAAGAILYVVIQQIGVGHPAGRDVVLADCLHKPIEGYPKA